MKILFMCVANSARSQLAEGLAKNIFPGAEIQSAGSDPGTLNPFAVQVMREIGLDISGHFSKSINDLPRAFLNDLDYVITLCAEEVCPVLGTKAKKLHWPLSDPASKNILSDDEMKIRFRESREKIQSLLEQFKKELNL